MLTKLRNIFSSFAGVFGFILGVFIIVFPAYYFMNSQLIIGNLGYAYYVFELVFTIIIAVLFGLFLAGISYKMHSLNVKKTGVGAIGGFIGVLVSGCPACSITLASYVGLAGFMYLLPYSGLELKILSILILTYANYTLLRDIDICKTSSTKR